MAFIKRGIILSLGLFFTFSFASSVFSADPQVVFRLAGDTQNRGLFSVGSKRPYALTWQAMGALSCSGQAQKIDLTTNLVKPTTEVTGFNVTGTSGQASVQFVPPANELGSKYLLTVKCLFPNDQFASYNLTFVLDYVLIGFPASPDKTTKVNEPFQVRWKSSTSNCQSKGVPSGLASPQWYNGGREGVATVKFLNEGLKRFELACTFDSRTTWTGYSEIKINGTGVNPKVEVRSWGGDKWGLNKQKQVYFNCSGFPEEVKFRVGFYKNGIWGWSKYLNFPECREMTTKTVNFSLPDIGVNTPTLGDGNYILIRAYNNDNSEYRPYGQRVEDFSDPFSVVNETITPPVITPPTPSISVTSNKNRVNQGEIARISWQTLNLVEANCSSRVVEGTSGWSSISGLTGYKDVKFQTAGEKIFKIECTKDGDVYQGEKKVLVLSSATPYINNVVIRGITTDSKDVWGVGNKKLVSWNYNNFNTGTYAYDAPSSPIRKVSLSLVNPKTNDLCLLSDSTNKKLDLVASGAGGTGSASFEVGLGVDLLELVNQGKPISKCFVTENENYKTKLRICPTVEISPGIATQVLGSYCSDSIFFMVKESESSTWDLPAGQGCLKGECVCVKGKRMICDNPFKPGTNCPASNRNYSSCGFYSLSDKLISSIGAVRDFPELIFNRILEPHVNKL